MLQPLEEVVVEPRLALKPSPKHFSKLDKSKDIICTNMKNVKVVALDYGTIILFTHLSYLYQFHLYKDKCIWNREEKLDFEQASLFRTTTRVHMLYCQGCFHSLPL